MRILTLSFQNLNSLKGNWHIDFTDPAYDDSGIFAITGQTGAGKTTILDAICLALYGKTPRVEIISKSTNEVMSRGCFECMAEIEIDIKGTVYRCHWSQYRARKKADGNLQDITHTISKIEHIGDSDGKIIESKSSLTKKEIIDTVGMDFEQFTRSVLLAQGDFSKFLKAKSDDRANILEKITGTDIYANISRRVFDRKRTNEQKLKELTASLDGIELLSTEEIEHIHHQLTAQQTEQENNSKTLITLNEKINWQNSIAQLNENIISQKNELATAQKSQNDFSDDATRITQALKALEIESDYQQFERTLKQNKDAISKQNLLHQQLPNEQANLSQADEQLKTAKIAFKQAEVSLTEQLSIITEVKTLDNRLSILNQRLDDSQNQHIQLATSLENRKQFIIDNQHKTANSVIEIKQINDYLMDNANHASLNIDRDNLISSCKNIKSLLLDTTIAQTKLHNHTEQAKNIEHQKQDVTKKIAVLDSVFLESECHYKQLETDIANLLNGKLITDWRADSTKLNDSEHQLKTLEQNHQQLSQCYESIEKLISTRNDLHAEKQQLDISVDAQNHILDTLQQQCDGKNELLALQQQVIKLEQYIDTLQDDESCPLCGSIEHPYLRDLQHGSHPNYTPSNDQSRKITELHQGIENINNEIKEEQQQLNQDKQCLAVNANQLTDNEKQQNTFSNQLNTILDSIRTAHAELLDGVDLQTPDYATIIKDIGNHVNAKKIQSQQAKLACHLVIEQCNKLEQQLAQLKIDSEQLTTQRNQSQNQIHEINTQIKLCEQQQAHIQEVITSNIATLSTDIHRLETVLNHQKLTLPHQLGNAVQQLHTLSEQDIDSLFANFRDIVKDWGDKENLYTTKNQQKIVLEKSIGILQSSLSELQKQQTTAQQEFEKVSLIVNEQKIDYQHTLENRHQLFADKNPISEENRLRKAMEETQYSLNHNKERHQALQYTVDGLTKELAEVVTQITNNQSLLETQRSQFNEQLSKYGFVDINQFKSVRLPQDEREKLQTLQNKITHEVNRLQSLLDNNQKHLEETTAKKLTEMPLVQLENSMEEIQITSHQLAQKIGANQQIINDNEIRKSTSSKQQQAIDKQKKDSHVWEQLNTLIGSSEGKKFRVFAQGLTFDDMIRGANEQLQKMSDRYLLIRDSSENSKEPLELNVIDNYQAGEIRSCKNLSGGESFIISLALALGLSKMASSNANSKVRNNANKNMSVDSLFLDEGFGTLDEDSLDIALDTLTNLRQQGKLIGVISHVQALKDRIHTQIKVEKISGGVSRLRGSGITPQ